MEIPKSVKIGAHIFEVIQRDDLESGNLGSSSVSKLKIFIDETAPESLQIETLFHEILHVIYDLSGIKKEEAEEEKEVQAIAGYLFQVLQDNRWLK